MATLTPMKAIRAKCKECKSNRYSEIANCENEACPLFEYRFGKKPDSQKREYTEEERAAMRERMAKMRAAQNKG